MKFGVSLYGVFNSKGCSEEVVKAISDIGYGYVEPCVCVDVIKGLETTIIPMRDYDGVDSLFRKYGLKVHSCHLFSSDITDDMDKILEFGRKYGIKQFVVKSPAELTKESIQETAFEYRALAQRLEEIGCELLIHNEEADISTIIEGKTAYEYLLEACLGKVFAQVDVGWAMYGGQSPAALLWRIKELVKSVHYKDFKSDNSNGDKYKEVMIGSSDLDMDSVFQFARAFGHIQISDQDSSEGDILDDLKSTYIRFSMLTQCRENSVSYLNILDTVTGKVKVLHRFDKVIEAPNWVKSSNSLIFNSEGKIWNYDIESGEVREIPSYECDNCNNDHVLSPDEKQIAVSHGKRGGGFESRIYILPIGGGEPRLITPNTPSFLHGWSPDGKELAYCAFRMQDDGMQVDVYAIEVPDEGKDAPEERRLTMGGFNDGPEYSPDGKHIWFNSTRSGLMQVWRMNRDGSEQTQMTDNDRNNWFPHVAPDCKKVVYLSYAEGELAPNEHLPNMNVEIWKMDYDGENKEKLLSFFGGQGSINVNSWSEDSRYVAFVSYELMHEI